MTPDVEWLEITTEAYNAIKARSRTPGEMLGQQTSDTTWLVTLRSETMERLRKQKFDTESFSDVIVRIMSVTEKGMN